MSTAMDTTITTDILQRLPPSTDGVSRPRPVSAATGRLRATRNAGSVAAATAATRPATSPRTRTLGSIDASAVATGRRKLMAVASATKGRPKRAMRMPSGIPRTAPAVPSNMLSFNSSTKTTLRRRPTARRRPTSQLRDSKTTRSLL
jgi:hypothetical protein